MPDIESANALLQRWALLSQAYQLFGRMVERSLGQWDMRCTQHRTLSLIKHTEDGVSPSNIASYFAQEIQSVTSLLQRMEQRELVCRQPDPSDGRSVFIELTERGLEVINECEPAARAAAEAFFKAIPPEQLPLFDQMLRLLRDAAAAAVGVDIAKLDAPITNFQYDEPAVPAPDQAPVDEAREKAGAFAE